MKFSVLMAVYFKDNPIFLTESLFSIYDKQILKPDQIVIVLDGHITEDLDNVISLFKNSHNDIVHIVNLENNIGLGGALRIGVDHCIHEIIMRMDSDDISCPDRFFKQINFMEKNPNIDVCGSFISEFFENPYLSKYIRKVPVSHHKIVKKLIQRNPINHVTVCMRKTSLIKAGSYQSLLLLEDYLLWINMYKSNCKFYNLPEVLVNVRIGNGFFKKRSSRQRIDGWIKIQEVMHKHNMIGFFRKYYNIFLLFFFIYTPIFIKKYLYTFILRKRYRNKT